MNNQLSNSKGGEYNSNQGIARSQKMLNSISNIHVKTEHQQRNEDVGSPDHQMGKLRQTWRRPRMPYNKLPEAFQLKQKKKRSNRQVIDNIDRIVKYNEYKEIQKYLEPISLQKKPQELSSRDFIENGNPLATYHKYLKIKTKFSEQLQDKDLSINKYKALSVKQPSSSFRIADSITLQLLKRGHNTGTIKKMLHVPTLKLLCIRQQPLNTKQSRHAIKEWLIFWQNKLSGEDNRFISIYATTFNNPQGAVSILTEYAKFGSLKNLIELIVTLPETVIREIFVEIFENLVYFYELTDMPFGGLSPSQIIITDQNKIKLNLGLFYHFPETSNSIYNIRSYRPNLFQFNTTQKNFMKLPLQKSTNLEIERSLDVFKLGLMMLQCAIGSFQNLEQSSILQESLKIFFSEQGQKLIQNENICCLIHSQQYLLQNVGQQDERSKRDRLQFNKVIFYIKLLKDRFSLTFINFLCLCLKLHHHKRATFYQLLQHSFLKNQTSKDVKTVSVNLSDLLLINNDYNQQEYIQSMQQQRLDKFIGHVLHVLNGCRRQLVIDLLANQKEKIINLAKYIGLNYVGLGQKLFLAMNEMIKIDKRDFTTSI